ncbi:MAG: M1 family metallopeptidase [Bacteroidota bacterium]
MKRFFLFVSLLFIWQLLSAQNKSLQLNQSNWQQHVAYTISVKLNDNTNALQGNISMVYTNNSPDEIKEIYMHVWPNAYSGRTTAFAKQHLENGKTDFYFAKPEEQGRIDSLNFAVNNTAVSWKLTNEVDIALLTLNNVLKPGEKITISTPFYVLLPNVYSRMGHEDQLYCITQWFPKPAVYDVNGWNPIPYLDQGEFYSEFGSFDVSITVPKNYIVAATGNLQNEDEKAFLLARSKEEISTENIITSTETKTLRYLQDSVHDFAWFCSKKFNVKKGSVTLASGRKVDTWLFAKKANDKGIEYTNEAIKYYSEHVGEYPYSLVQVVITPLKAGGGMEYPTITNCGNIDRTTIIHEVGHNWFYGILGSNERAYPWMDESINTYYESRCSKEKNDKDAALSPIPQKNILKDVFNADFEDFGQLRLLYNYSARSNQDQPGNLNSVQYTDLNYGAIIYSKNPITFYMLQNYLGDKLFDDMMRAYYQKWKFKHPLPNDFKNHAESFTSKDLSWFFNEIMATDKKMDYKISQVKNNQVVVKNVSGLNVPFSLTSLNYHNKPIRTMQYEGFTGKKIFDLTPLLAKDSIMHNLVLDNNQSSIELYRKNNGWKNKYTVRFLPALESNNKRQIFCIPLYAWNNYNGNMLGLFINNDIFPAQKVEWNITPLYSFTSNDINGYFSIAKNIYPSSALFRRIKIGLNASRFATQGLLPTDGYVETTYEKFAPGIEIDFKQANARSLFENSVMVRHVSVLENKRGSGYFSNWDNQSISAFDATYKLNHKLATYPTAIKANLQVGTADYTYSRVTAEINQGIAYNTGKKKAYIRLFAGTFLNAESTSKTDWNLTRTYFQLGGTNGANDYFYDEAMFGRAEQNQQQSVLARQIIGRDAGFRNFVSLGNSKTWLTAANITLPFPYKLPIGVYADCSYGEVFAFAPQTGATTYQTQFSIVGGVYISLAKNIFEIYIPLFASQNVTDSWKNNGGLEHPFERVSFLLNLNAMNPVKIIKNFKL